MQKYYDSENYRLVYLGDQSDNEYWDGHWETTHFRMSVDSFIVNTTKKYLSPGSKVLEGGCGLGGKVYSLHKSGFQAVGIDYAEKTVKLIKDKYPELDVRLGDVRKLDLNDGEFDGYWSLGVIEHFFDGYGEIADEMKRVLKPGGYLFLTVPTFSPLRRWKAKKNKYPLFDVKTTPYKNSFYQFAISEEEVIKHFTQKGFELLKLKKMDGLKGFKDEIPKSKMLQSLYDGKSLPVKVIRKAMNIVLSPFAPHITLYILRKKS